MTCEQMTGINERPEGWHDWGKEAAHETAVFAEFECSYAGRAEDATGGLRRHLSDEDVSDYGKDKVLGLLHNDVKDYVTALKISKGAWKPF